MQSVKQRVTDLRQTNVDDILTEIFTYTVMMDIARVNDSYHIMLPAYELFTIGQGLHHALYKTLIRVEIFHANWKKDVQNSQV